MTHEQKVLNYMKAHHGAITSLEAFKYLNNTRLAVSIDGLRKKGYEIDTVMESYKKVNGERVRFGRYHLKKEPNVR